MNRIIALTGPAGVGKSTVAKALAAGPARALDPRPWRILSFAAPIKRMALASGIVSAEELEKKDEAGSFGITPRKILQTLGTEWGRETISQDVWVALMLREIQSEDTPVIIDDLRFENEAKLVLASPAGSIVQLERPGFASPARSHSSEAGIPNGLLSLIVPNLNPQEAAWNIARWLSR